ncbi:hypothetical protein SAVIM40S_03809 [Streptomyces avidinii]|uniref:Uncharacterized protein n=1 Tax=Streptomyces avidinii TaxID=1895 RepID=A0ABS4KZL2_STRAV|nr:hypothetical protein [Streptomyces avidinii]
MQTQPTTPSASVAYRYCILGSRHAPAAGPRRRHQVYG